MLYSSVRDSDAEYARPCRVLRTAAAGESKSVVRGFAALLRYMPLVLRRE